MSVEQITQFAQDPGLIAFVLLAIIAMLLIAGLIRVIIYMPLHFYKAKTRRLEIAMRADSVCETRMAGSSG